MPEPPSNFIVPDRGKLLLTAGFNDADGAGGGGLVPFALITGYGTSDSYGENAHDTYAPLRTLPSTSCRPKALVVRRSRHVVERESQVTSHATARVGKNYVIAVVTWTWFDHAPNFLHPKRGR